VNITSYRSQFDLHFLAPPLDVFRLAKEMLREKGHSVLHSLDEKQFLEDFKKKPSHLVIVDIQQLNTYFEDFIAECLEKAPNTHFIGIGINSYRRSLREYREHGLLDFVEMNDALVSQLDWVVDNSLERVILKIQNQNLLDEKHEAELKQAHLQSEIDNRIQNEARLKLKLTEDEDFGNLVLSYEAAKTREDVLQTFFHSLRDFYDDGAKILFFKYLQPINLLVATHCSGIPLDQIKGAGVKLSQEESRDPRSFLLKPQGFTSLSILLRDVFAVSEYHCKALVVREEIDGVFIFFGEDLAAFNSIRFNNKLSVFKVAYERFVFLKRLIELEVEDTLETVYNLDDFQETLSEQVDQVQRLRSSVSLLRISIDNVQAHEEKSGPTAVDSLIRYLVVMMKKITKVTDILHRTAPNEFCLILPHMKAQEATALGEKIRRLVEKSEFSALADKPTVSIGLSVYPQLAKNSEQLLKGTLQALNTVMNRGGNKVGVVRLAQHGKTHTSSNSPQSIIL
jgi:diguanylate cyclase (GGDEF)-like protein